MLAAYPLRRANLDRFGTDSHHDREAPCGNKLCGFLLPRHRDLSSRQDLCAREGVQDKNVCELKKLCLHGKQRSWIRSTSFMSQAGSVQEQTGFRIL